MSTVNVTVRRRGVGGGNGGQEVQQAHPGGAALRATRAYRTGVGVIPVDLLAVEKKNIFRLALELARSEVAADIPH